MMVNVSSIPDIPARHSIIYRLISIFLLTLIFYQPYTLRLSIWSSIVNFASQYSDDAEQQQLHIVLFGGMTLHTIVFITLNLIMTIIYYINHPYFEQYKISSKPFPFRDSDPVVRQQYYMLVKKSLMTLLFNSYIISPLLFMSGWGRAKALTSVSLDDVPHWYTSAWHIVVFMIVEDTLFYWAHRMLHHKLIYKYIHKQHHEYKQPIGVASEYAHWVEFIFSNAIPFTVGPQLLHSHCYTFFIWYIWRIGETIDGHSGYEFPWVPYRLLPFSGSATFHDYHHSRNVGNYSSFFTYWDQIMGTNQTYPQYIEKIEQQAVSEQKKILITTSCTE